MRQLFRSQSPSRSARASSSTDSVTGESSRRHHPRSSGSNSESTAEKLVWASPHRAFLRALAQYRKASGRALAPSEITATFNQRQRWYNEPIVEEEEVLQQLKKIGQSVPATSETPAARTSTISLILAIQNANPSKTLRDFLKKPQRSLGHKSHRSPSSTSSRRATAPAASDPSPEAPDEPAVSASPAPEFEALVDIPERGTLRFHIQADRLKRLIGENAVTVEESDRHLIEDDDFLSS